jgi:6-phosphofructokinase 1
MLPRKYISKDGYSITQACRQYIEPLIQGEDYPPYQKGMPKRIKLKNIAVTKLLNNNFVV